MNKKLLALAVAAAIAPAAAMADGGNVTVSGKIGMDVTFVNGTGKTGAADNNTHQVNNNNSIITFAGSEDMGNGNKAFFSLTYGLPMTNKSGTDTTASQSNGGIAGQNQIVGIEGKSWGKAFVGAFDNPLKVMGRGVDLFADQSTGDSRYLTGLGAVEARANDVVAYITPSFNGAQLVLAHSNNPLGTVATDAFDGATANQGSSAMNIIKLAYANGPLSAALGYHRVDSQNINNAVGDETATRLVGSYTAGALKFVGSWQKVDHAYNKADTAAGANTKTWGLGAAYTTGATTIKGQYYKLTDDVANSGANMIALGADYAMSKRTTLQLAYSKVNNDDNVGYGVNAAVAGSDALSLSANGKDPSRVSLGIKHTF